MKDTKDIYDKLCSCMKGEHNIFTYVNFEKVGELCEFVECRNAVAGEVLWEEGSFCDNAVFVVSGRVEVKKQTDIEGKHVIVGIYGRGEVADALCILNGDQKRTVTGIALEDVSLGIMNKGNFDRLIDEKPELGAQLMKGMLLSASMQLRQSFERLAAFF